MKANYVVSVSVLLLTIAACGGSARVDGGEGGGSGGAWHSVPVTPPGGSSSSGSAGTASAGGAQHCERDGTSYPEGSHWRCECNTCFCGPGGVIGGTGKGCGPCVYAGLYYFEGDRFRALDACNTCTCEADGGASCTGASCECKPEQEWYHEYRIKDANACALAELMPCPTNTHAFGNQCGCGCEQDPSCPEYVDCTPGAFDCEAMKAKCPFSKIAI